ncbi:MAG: class I SAM-dependent methyltransferase [Pseudolysinimonas sp.]
MGIRSSLLNSRATQSLLDSPLAPVAAFPFRLAATARAAFRQIGAGGRWLVTSRENTNYTYDLTPRNREHLAWFVANLAGIDVEEARGYLTEIETDTALAAYVTTATRESPRRWLADTEARFGRRVGWYALVRALKPSFVVETGTDKGLGTLVLAAAILRNGSGRLTTIDINPASGFLIGGQYATVTERIVGDGVATLKTLSGIDFFIHDSDHSAEYEAQEFETITKNLSAAAIVLSDNSASSDSLPLWAEKNHRRFTFFDEQPARHWYEGAGIGASLP